MKYRLLLILTAMSITTVTSERRDPFYLEEELPDHSVHRTSGDAVVLAVASDDNGATALIEYHGDVHHVTVGNTIGDLVIEAIEDESVTIRRGQELNHLSVGALVRIENT